MQSHHHAVPPSLGDPMAYELGRDVIRTMTSGEDAFDPRLHDDSPWPGAALTSTLQGNLDLDDLFEIALAE